MKRPPTERAAPQYPLGKRRRTRDEPALSRPRLPAARAGLPAIPDPRGAGGRSASAYRSCLSWAARGAALASCAGWMFSVVRGAAQRWDGAAVAARAATAAAAPAPRAGAQVYRIIVALDIEQFGHPERDDQIRVQLREALSESVTRALTEGGVPHRHWQASSTGDGLLLVVEPVVETARVVRALLDRLPAELDDHNRLRVAVARLRIRAVVHSAHVMLDQHGALGEHVNLLFRLLDADALRAWLAWTPQPSVVAVSEDVYRQVVRQRVLGLDPQDFHPLFVEVKETRARAWVYACGRCRIASRAGQPAEGLQLPGGARVGGSLAA